MRGLVSILVLVVVGLLPASAGARIVDGSAAPAGAYPAQAQLSVGSGGQSTLCGGTLIDAQWVLTAAHCVSDEDSGELAAPSAVTVRLGSVRLYAGTAHAVDVIERSPDWNAATLTSDAAVVHLTEPAAEAPMAIASTAEFGTAATPGATARIVGWGQTSTRGSASPTLQHGDVPIVADTTCASRRVYGSSYVAATMLCAGGQDADACYGDSGGPLLVDADPSADIAWRLAGVVSWGHDCGAAGYPGVYTDLSNARLRAWIDGTVSGTPVVLPPDAAGTPDVSPAVAPTPVTEPAAAQPAPVVATPAVASIGLPRACRRATCRVDLRFPSAGAAILKLVLPRVTARKLAAHGARSVTLARSMVIARHAGTRTVKLRLSKSVRRAMKRAGVRTLRAQLRVEVLAYGTHVVGANRAVRISR